MLFLGASTSEVDPVVPSTNSSLTSPAACRCRSESPLSLVSSPFSSLSSGIESSLNYNNSKSSNTTKPIIASNCESNNDKTSSSSEPSPVIGGSPPTYHSPYKLRINTEEKRELHSRVPAPLLSDSELNQTVAGFSEETLSKTLDLFVLSATRVNLMTSVYLDINATTSLLEERERDLELAARIGQSLLERNNELNARNEALEQRLSALNEIVAQLHHKLELKNDLLAFYTQALDSAEDEAEQHHQQTSFRNQQNLNHSSSSSSSSPKSPPPHHFLSYGEDDKYRDRSASCSVSVQCDSTSPQEDSGLLQTCLRQLSYLSNEVERLTSEVTVKTAEVIRQQSEIESLTDHIENLQLKLTQSDDENARMGERLEEATDAQTLLANEVGGLKARYDECLDLLREAQQEIRALKKRQRSCRPVVHYFSTTPSSAPEQRVQTLEEALELTNCSTPSRSASNSLLVAAEPVSSASAICTCQQNQQKAGLRRVSSDCDSDAGYAADSDSMLESLVCSPNPTSGQTSQNLSVRTLSPCLSTSPSQCGSDSMTPKFRKSPSLSSRLKIVKPIEGSVTMHRWQALAHPTLSSSALDSLPGILPKDGRDPVSDMAIPRNQRHYQEHSRNLETALSVITSGCEVLNFGLDDTTEDMLDSMSQAGERTSSAVPDLHYSQNSVHPMYLLDDEEELYGDFEVVETRNVSSLPNQPVVMNQTAASPVPSEQSQCCSETPSSSNRTGSLLNGFGAAASFFNRLANIHRNKGLQGLNLSPPPQPNSPSRSLMTRSVTMPENCRVSPPKQQDVLPVTNFHMPMPVPSCDGGPLLVSNSQFTSSFLPKYRQFLLKHNLQSSIDSDSAAPTFGATHDRIEEDLDETREEEQN